MKKTSYNLFKIISFILVVILLGVLYKSPITIHKRIVYTPKRIPKTRHVMPINISTRKVEDYRQIGILSSSNGKVLPLFGRRTYNGSSRWNYFTQANDHLALKIPLSKDNKDCDSSTGCDELYDNDIIFVSQYNTDFAVKLYDNTPRYIPY